MVKVPFYITILLPLLVILCSDTQIQDEKNKNQTVFFQDEGLTNNLQDRKNWEWNRVKDPVTNSLPKDIRARELEFASSLPNDASFSSYRDVMWVNRGPYNIGGRTRAFAFDIQNENILIAGGISGGIWRSVNSGSSWDKITPFDQMLSVSCIAQDKRSGKTSTWYYGTGEAYGNSAGSSGAYFYGDGIFKSQDNGLTWTQISSTASKTKAEYNSFDVIWKIALDPSNDTQDVVYTSAIRRIYKSTNGGDTWKMILGGDYGGYFTDIEVSSKGVVYASMSNENNVSGIWRSTDGEIFTNILPKDTFPAKFDRVVIGIDPNNENVVYFLAHTPGYGKKSINYRGDEDWNSLWKYRYLGGDGSGSNGKWENLTNQIPSKANKSFDDFSAQGSYNMVVKVQPGDSNLVIIAGTNIYRSTDAFRTAANVRQIGGYGVGTVRPKWIVYPNHHPDQHEIIFSQNNPNILYNANDGGVFKTSDFLADTVVWTSLNNGYLTTQLYTINIQQDAKSDVIISGLQDNGNLFVNSNNPQQAWVLPLNGDGSYSAIAKNRDYFILSTQLGRMIKAKLDDQGTRLTFSRIDPIGGRDYLFINPFVLDPNGDNKLYLAAGAAIWRNDSIRTLPYIENYDSIKTGWVKFTDTVEFPNRVISALAVSKSNPANRLYFGTSKSVVYRVDNANTGNPTTTRITTLSNPGYVNCITIDPDNADQLFVVFSNYKVYSLYYSKDGGASWSKVAGNLEDKDDGTGDGPSIRWVEILKTKDGTKLYFAGTSVGLFATDTLAGVNTKWTQIGLKTIGNVVVDMIKTRESDGLVVVATHGNGTYSAKVNSAFEVLGTPLQRIGVEKELSIFPNPCSDFTNFSYYLKNPGKVSFSIIDLNGNIISHSEIENVNSGLQMKQLNTSKLSSGMYFLQLNDGTTKQLKSFIVK